MRVNAGIKNLFDWFYNEYPDYNLMLRDAPNGFYIVVSESGGNSAERALIYGRDFDETNAFDVIRANVPELIDAVQFMKRGNE